MLAKSIPIVFRVTNESKDEMRTTTGLIRRTASTRAYPPAVHRPSQTTLCPNPRQLTTAVDNQTDNLKTDCPAPTRKRSTAPRRNLHHHNATSFAPQLSPSAPPPFSSRPRPPSYCSRRRKAAAPEPDLYTAPHAPLHSTGQYSPSNLSPYRFPSRRVSCEHL